MGPALLTLGAAVLGGLVTLMSVLLTQRGAERLRREDLERLDRHRLEDRKHTWDTQVLEGRRASYARINAAARSARDALVACSVEFLDSGSVAPETGAVLDSVWAAYVAQHAEAQMSVSDEVLVALGAVNGSLRKMHGLVQGLRRGTADRESALQELDVRRSELWDRLTVARDEMRKDLGIAPGTWQPGTPQESL